jgi:pimeloyl-ACP methyl ester carboxylesterase
MATYVLVHGSWHGSWCWEKVAPLLEARGHSVITPDLPGHGEGSTSAAGKTLADYIEAIVKVIDVQPEPVVLVGHSMAGMVVSGVAEARPEKVAELVYLAAYIPRSGQSLIDNAQQDGESALGPALRFDEAGGVHTVESSAIIDALYADCSPGDAERAKARLIPESNLPVFTPAALSDRYEDVSKTAIICLLDRANSASAQRRMAEATPGIKIRTIDTSHSPFYAAPGELAGMLDAIPTAAVR